MMMMRHAHMLLDPQTPISITIQPLCVCVCVLEIFQRFAN